MGSNPTNSVPKMPAALPGGATAARLQGDIIQDDRVCPGCSYNLKGLRTGDRCPECAMPIPMRVGARHGWMMTHSPVEYLHGLAHGSIWMLASAGVLVGSLVWIGVELAWNSSFSRPVGIFAVLAAIGWLIGVCMVTVPRPQEPGNPGTRVAEWRKLRWTARVSQFAWVLGTGLVLNAGWMAAAAAAGGSPTVSSLGVSAADQAESLFFWGCGFLVVGLIGLSAVAFYLALLADWADDPALARKLRLTPFALLGAAILAGLMIAARPLLHDVVVLFVLIPTLAVMAGLFLLCASHFGIALVQFANVGVWAEQNAATALDSGRRMSSKIVKRVVDAQAKPPAHPIKAPKFYKPAKPQGAYVAPKGDGGIYEVASPPAPEATSGSNGPTGPTTEPTRPST
jgi:hypothetical protein